MTDTPPDVGIVGAGVTGLACALLLAESGYKVTIVARDLPGDMTISWASPWAGALLAPHPDGDAEVQSESLRYYQDLAHHEPAAGVKATHVTEYYDDRDHNASVWYQGFYPDFRFLPLSELPAPAKLGFQYTGMTVNPTDLLPWLTARVRRRGVTLARATISSLQDLRDLTQARVLINASGLGSQILAKDDNVVSVRGQTMFVKCAFTRSMILQGSEYTYVIPRLSAGGVILGGVSQPSTTNAAVDPDLKKDILRRVNLMTGDAFDWVDVERDVKDIVGFRPSRRGGVRIEREGDTIHAYGAGSLGYVYAFGIASRVRDLVRTMDLPKL